MKKLFALLLICLFFAACSKESLKHDTAYKNWNHVKFSWWQYRSPTAEHAKMSEEQGWWGEEIPYIPAE